MLKQFYPYEYAESVFAIDYEKLWQMGYRGLLFDIDNTLVHHGDDSTPEIDALFREIQAIGFKTLLLSNNEEKRINRFMQNITSYYIHDAEKPKPWGYLKAAEIMELDKNQCVVIGDQVFTDVFGANRVGMASILVRFIRLPGLKKLGKRRRAEQAVLLTWRLRPVAIRSDWAASRRKRRPFRKHAAISATSIHCFIKSPRRKKPCAAICRI